MRILTKLWELQWCLVALECMLKSPRRLALVVFRVAALETEMSK